MRQQPQLGLAFVQAVGELHHIVSTLRQKQGQQAQPEALPYQFGNRQYAADSVGGHHFGEVRFAPDDRQVLGHGVVGCYPRRVVGNGWVFTTQGGGCEYPVFLISVSIALWLASALHPASKGLL